VHWCQKRS